MTGHLTSEITWVDLRPDDVKAARTYLDTLESEEGQRDELGFLPLQALFADRFYPATTTQMSIARYFVLLPQIYQRIEAQGLHGTAARARARGFQTELRLVLQRHGGPKVRKMDVSKHASDYYWTSFFHLGLCTRDLTERQYTDEVGREADVLADDEGDPIDSTPTPFWDRRRSRPELFSAHGKLLKSIKPGLSHREAKDLLARFERLPGDCTPAAREARNMLCHMVNKGRTQFAHVWDIPRPPSHLAGWLHHAKMLSLFARGVRIQYELLLLEKRAIKNKRAKKNEKVFAEAARDAFGKWHKHARDESLGNWDIRNFLMIDGVNALVGSRPAPDGDVLTFFDRWLARFRNVRGATRLLDDDQARDEIRGRERRCKLGRARLDNDEQLALWHPEKRPPTAYALDFRHPRGRQIAAEILAKLGKQ
jgi:hypothetical protein